jgi:hypothetical protein
MKVTITVGQTTRELEVRDDLMDRGNSLADRYQNIAERAVSVAFTQAYIEEVHRAESA